jgi:LDH2 family malate/lactate/ureidoglycolate dehydrogenase
VGINGLSTNDPVSLLDDMLFKRGGGLLPLGGEGEAMGGHKGFGLAVLVDIMTALCSGGDFGSSVMDSDITSARVCHFFMALKLDLFREAKDFKNDISRMLKELTSMKPAEGADRVYYAGLKEHEAEARCEKEGVPLGEGVWETLKTSAEELGIPVPSPMSTK